jgi:hypothetical protein
VLLLTVLAAPQPATAQATVSATVGLDGHYKSDHWVPLRVVLTNQGPAARVEVRARLQPGGLDSLQEHRLKERDLPSGARQVFTLPIKMPVVYGSASMEVDLLRDGKVINSVQPKARMVEHGGVLILGTPATQPALMSLNGGKVPFRVAQRQANGRYSGMQGSITSVLLDPQELPDRWQGLDAADMVVVGGIGERELAEEQWSALREYAAAGGTLVITGGLNWQRLTSSAFASLLPVKASGTRVVSRVTGLQGLGGASGPSGGGCVLTVSSLLPGARVAAEMQGMPLVVERRFGAGKVVFCAFDPSAPPFAEWVGTRSMWSALVAGIPDPELVSLLARNDDPVGEEYGARGPRLSLAPFSISQLDVPAFYVVALFLVAYIIVLVPVNYFVLKARDRKELAWLTTPAIVLVFSVGAYLVGYHFKGGRMLVVQVGLIETHARQTHGRVLSYFGLFSPRKADYSIEPTPAAAGGSPMLLCLPSGGRQSEVFKSVHDEGQQVEGFGIDMWAMRVLRGEAMLPLGSGIRSALTRGEDGSVAGVITNGTAAALEDCFLVRRGATFPVGTIEPGGERRVAGKWKASTASGGTLPAGLLEPYEGRGERERVRRGVLAPLCSQVAPGWQMPSHPLLVGWVRDKRSAVTVDGRTPRLQSATLVVAHLDD